MASLEYNVKKISTSAIHTMAHRKQNVVIVDHAKILVDHLNVNAQGTGLIIALRKCAK